VILRILILGGNHIDCQTPWRQLPGIAFKNGTYHLIVVSTAAVSRHSWGGGFMLFGMTLSARNRLAGEIVELEFGGVMAHVVVRVGKDMIESVITKRSAEEMKLKIGDKVSAVIKSTEVMLEKS